MCRHTNYPSPGPHTGILQWLKLLQHAAFSVMKHEPGQCVRTWHSRGGNSSLQAIRTHDCIFPSLISAWPFPAVPHAWKLAVTQLHGTGTGVHGTLGWPRAAPRIPIPLLEMPNRSISLETHKPGMGEGKENGLLLLVFFARMLIRCGNQRLKVTYTAIASHAEPNIHRRKYCINYNAEQHSISAIVPLQL